jgi:soluble lytic murein transglycosylase-like protein
VIKILSTVWFVSLMLTASSASVIAQASGYEAAAYEACAYYGCSGDYLVAIMNCESGQDPSAWHPNPYGGADIGIMQINDATHGAIAYAGPIDQIWWSAEQLAEGKASMWSCS